MQAEAGQKSMAGKRGCLVDADGQQMLMKRPSEQEERDGAYEYSKDLSRVVFPSVSGSSFGLFSNDCVVTGEASCRHPWIC